jgi:HlyD family secretion protein
MKMLVENVRKKAMEIWAFVRRQPRWRPITAGIIFFLAVFWIFSGGKSALKNEPTFAARRGPLDITVLAGGSLKALESQEIKCEVRVGYQGTKILKIVPEGYFVTDDDVRTNKVLCELDSSDLQDKIVQQEIQFQSALASLADAQQNYEIQLSENDSSIKTAQQTVQFACMDFEEYLGATVGDKIIAETGLNKILEAVNRSGAQETSALTNESGNAVANPAATNTPPGAIVAAKVAAAATGGKNSDPRDPPDDPADEPGTENAKPLLEIPAIVLDFSKYASMDALGDGQAKQKLRQLDAALETAQKNLGQAKTQLDGTRRLYDKGFVAKSEITRDEISYDSADLSVKSAETDRALFLAYDFPHTAEQDLSKYAEAVRGLDKAYHEAISKLAQARAKLNSAKGQYELQLHQRQDLREQLAKCTLTAKKSGLVVYGGDNQNYYGNQEPIQEGATVRERQTIITIPDLRRMSVEVTIHESYIKKIKAGQKARITVDAYPDQRLTGEVTKVGVLPDSQNRWLNPDLKVYLTTVTIDGTNTWLKPGMTAKVEILVDHLDNVVYVPVQAVVPDNGKQFCYVADGSKADRREVTVGQFNDDFIEIKKGLKEGERVLLNPPENTAPTGEEKGPVESSPAPTAKPS